MSGSGSVELSPGPRDGARKVALALGRAAEQSERFPGQWRSSLKTLQARSRQDGVLSAQELTAGAYWLIDRLRWIEGHDQELGPSCRNAERELRTAIAASWEMPPDQVSRGEAGAHA